jgi:furry protein family
VEALLTDALGPGADPEFDTILDSLGRVALKQAKLVIEAITRWRRSQTSEHLPDSVMRRHMPEHVDRMRRLDIKDRLIRRREVRGLACLKQLGC